MRLVLSRFALAELDECLDDYRTIAVTRDKIAVKVHLISYRHRNCRR